MTVTDVHSTDVESLLAAARTAVPILAANADRAERDRRLPAESIAALRNAGAFALLTELGADELIDYTTVRFEEAVTDIDLVIDLVSDQHDTSIRSLEALRPGGLLVAIPAGVSPELATAAESKGVRVSPFLAEPDGPALAEIGELIDSGSVQVRVEEVLPFEQAATAHTRGESNRTRGKLVLRVVP